MEATAERNEAHHLPNGEEGSSRILQALHAICVQAHKSAQQQDVGEVQYERIQLSEKFSCYKVQFIDPEDEEKYPQYYVKGYGIYEGPDQSTHPLYKIEKINHNPKREFNFSTVIDFNPEALLRIVSF